MQSSVEYLTQYKVKEQIGIIHVDVSKYTFWHAFCPVLGNVMLLKVSNRAIRPIFRMISIVHKSCATISGPPKIYIYLFQLCIPICTFIAPHKFSIFIQFTSTLGSIKIVFHSQIVANFMG